MPAEMRRRRGSRSREAGRDVSDGRQDAGRRHDRCREGSIRELDRFEPAPGDVVVRTRAAAVCTTERRIFSGDIAIPFPVIGGHEVSGTH